MNTLLFSERGFDQALSLDRAFDELIINLIAWHEQAVMSMILIDSRKTTASKYWLISSFPHKFNWVSFDAQPKT